MEEDMDNTLYSHYEEKVRPCIDLIDSLRALGVDQDLSLPTIAVIGDQSSGKSSVLEALSGVALPRGSGIVTRCPLELKLKKGREENGWKGRISYKNYMKDLKEPAEVEAEVIKAQNTMAGKDLGISSELISLEVESGTAPDLTLIDLPGIARVAVGNQPADIGDQIKQLISSYIKKQETINLVVIPCNVDIATTEALKMAQEADPSGERTLGVLTKPDLVDRGTEDSVLKVVRNEAVSLKKGYMIVRCRGQHDINEKITLCVALKKEQEFFREHEHFRQLLEERLASVHCLAGRLTTELVAQIRRSLPAISNQVRNKLEETKRELEALGIGVPEEDSERMCYLVDKIQEYCSDLTNITYGEYIKELSDDLKLYTVVREGFGEWYQYIIDQETEFEDDMRSELQKYIKNSRGRELPGFTNYRTFESLAKKQIMNLEEPAVKMVKEISDKVQTTFSQVAMLHFSGTPNLLREAKSKIDEIRQMQEKEAFRILKSLFKMEEMVYSQDGIYSYRLEKAYSKNKPNSKAISNSLPLLSLNTDITAMLLHLEVYYKIASNRLADLVPMVIRLNLLHESACKIQREMLHLIQEKDMIKELLYEEEDLAEKRKFLRNRQERLNKARQILVRY